MTTSLTAGALAWTIGAMAAATATPSEISAQMHECPERAAWDELILTHVQRYPGLGIEDLYKLLHQATLGSEHAVQYGDAEAWLTRELAELGDGPDEPLVDPLGSAPPGTDGPFVRIHLRPFVARGGVPHRLLEAFVTTASADRGDPGALACALSALGDLARVGELPWPDSTVTVYAAARAAEGYPAVHHSDAYERLYRPAYRVVAAELVDDVLDDPGASCRRSGSRTW